jgi:oligopeptide transport system substrate-binding protein
MRGLAGLVLVCLILLVGCGGDEASPGSDTSSRQPTGELRIAASNPVTLDPALITDVTSAAYAVEIFDGLVALDPSLKVVPDLAERWELSSDGRVYTFHLRAGAKFHSGRVVSAQDVKYSLERAADRATKSPTAQLYLGDIVGVSDRLGGQATAVSGIEAVDERTLRITIDAPKSYFLAKLALPAAYVVDSEQIAANPETWVRSPNGTGPFKLTQWALNERIVLEANAEYHLGAPGVARVIFSLSGDTGALFDSDQVDIASAPISRGTDSAGYVSAAQLSTNYIGFNQQAAPFDDIKVRQAFAMSIDRAQLAKTVLQDHVLEAKGVLPPGMPGFNPNLQAIPFDPVRAKQLLAESKYGTNLPAIRFVTTNGSANNLPVEVQAIAQMWRQNLGIEVQLGSANLNSFYRDLEAGRVHIFQFGWVADYPDPENFLDLNFHSRSPANGTRYSNPEVDRLLESARTQSSADQRYGLYRQAEQIVINDIGWLPLFHGKQGYLVKPAVKGYKPPPLALSHLRFVTVER